MTKQERTEALKTAPPGWFSRKVRDTLAYYRKLTDADFKDHSANAIDEIFIKISFDKIASSSDALDKLSDTLKAIRERGW